MAKKTMSSMLRSKYARLLSPLYSWCSCTSVKEQEEGESSLHCQTGAGGQVPSYHGQPQWETMPATSTACSAAKSAPESLSHTSSSVNEVMSSSAANDEEEVQGNKPVPCSETIDTHNLPEASCNVNYTSTPGEPATPFDISPAPSRKLSRTSLDSQDSQANLTASAETSGDPPAEPTIASSASRSTDNDSSTTNTNTTNINCTNSVSTSELSDGLTSAIDQRQEDKVTAAALHSSDYGRVFDPAGIAALGDGHCGINASEYLRTHFVPLLVQELQLGASLQEAAAAVAEHIEAHLASINSTLTVAAPRRCSDW